MIRFSPIFFVVCLTALGSFGCASFKARSSGLRANGLGGNAEVRPVRPGELDELTRAFADRYVGLLSSTCDALKKDNLDAVQRREAQELMLNCATNVYDIASNADAFTRMLDLVVVTNLVAGVWVEDGRARDTFADRADVLIRALEHGQAESRALAVRVLRPDQLAVLDALMLDWRRENPDMVRMASVRFSNFAIGRGQSSTARILAARGWFANVETAGRSVDEARLQERGYFVQASTADEILQEMRDLASPIGAFIADWCTQGPGEQVVKRDLFDAWQAWCEGHNRKAGSAEEFGRNIRAAVPDVATSRPRDDQGERVQTYVGVGLTLVGQMEMSKFRAAKNS